MNVSVLIITYNRAKLLEKNFKELIKLKEIKQVVVVDDNSSDNTRKVAMSWKKKLPITYIKNKKNLGSACSWNIGLNKTNQEYVILLNDDTYIKQKDFFKFMEKDLEKAEIIGPRLKNTKYERGGFANRVKKVLIHYLIGDPLMPNGFKSRKTNFVSGVMFGKTEIFKKIGFDEEYIGNCFREESDFQMRAKKSGYRIYYEGKVYVLHDQTNQGGQRKFSKEEERKFRYLNHLRFLKKHYKIRKFFWISLYRVLYR